MTKLGFAWVAARIKRGQVGRIKLDLEQPIVLDLFLVRQFIGFGSHARLHTTPVIGEKATLGPTPVRVGVENMNQKALFQK